ncbi:MAG: M48 family metallopeptidase, partial [Patescibacteria group bacterium]
MKKQIELHKRKIEYTLNVSKRARGLRLAIRGNGDFAVTVPRDMNQSAIEKFIIDKSEWVLNKIDYFANFPRRISIKNNKKHYIEHKKATRELVEKRICHFNKIFNFKFNKITIRNQKTRWGSCSSKGNLNFNYKLALISEDLSD